MVPTLCLYVTSPTVNFSDIKYWALLLLHQLSLTEETHKTLISCEVIPIFALACSNFYGNTNMQKLCFHSLVRLLSSLEDDDKCKEIFEKLTEMHIIPLISSHLRNDDAELVSWSIFMLHEFSYRGY